MRVSERSSLSPTLHTVHGPAVLCGRAEDVSRLKLLSFIPPHVAARPPDGCNRTGHQPIPATSPTG